MCVCANPHRTSFLLSPPTKTVIILENGFIDRSKISLVDKHTGRRISRGKKSRWKDSATLRCRDQKAAIRKFGNLVHKRYRSDGIRS